MLRTDLFKTLDRDETRFIAVRDSLTKPDPEYTVKYFDAIHCKRGRLGIGWHFLILVSGCIQLGRDINTCGAHSKDIDEVSVGVGIVGGKNEDNEDEYTRTPDQLEALTDLIEVLSSKYPGATVHDDPKGINPSP